MQACWNWRALGRPPAHARVAVSLSPPGVHRVSAVPHGPRATGWAAAPRVGAAGGRSLVVGPRPSWAARSVVRPSGHAARTDSHTRARSLASAIWWLGRARSAHSAHALPEARRCQRVAEGAHAGKKHAKHAPLRAAGQHGQLASWLAGVTNPTARRPAPTPAPLSRLARWGRRRRYMPSWPLAPPCSPRSPALPLARCSMLHAPLRQPCFAHLLSGPASVARGRRRVCEVGLQRRGWLAGSLARNRREAASDPSRARSAPSRAEPGRAATAPTPSVRSRSQRPVSEPALAQQHRCTARRRALRQRGRERVRACSSAACCLIPVIPELPAFPFPEFPGSCVQDPGPRTQGRGSQSM